MMDHEERVRRFSTPWENLSPERQEQIIQYNEEVERMRAEGTVIPQSVQDKHHQFVPGSDENMQPLRPRRRQDEVESEDTNEQDRDA